MAYALVLSEPTGEPTQSPSQSLLTVGGIVGKRNILSAFSFSLLLFESYREPCIHHNVQLATKYTH